MRLPPTLPICVCAVALTIPTGIAAQTPDPFRLVEGDRVVLLGNALIEHERFHGFIEARLLRHFPEPKITFRNLGWSGDTVRGDARASGYQNPEGLDRLLREVNAQKPTVLIFGYGMNESFAGPDLIPKFIRDYESLLNRLAPPKSRVVLLSPTYHENLGPPFPDPAEHNRSIEAYSAAIRKLAERRQFAFVDLYASLAKAKQAAPDKSLTSNGILLNDLGYWHVAAAIEKELGLPGHIEWNSADKPAILPPPISPGGAIREENRVVIRGLLPGRHVLKIDGKVVASALAGDWDRGVRVSSVALDRDMEALRQAIVQRNDLFYRGWRPYNDHSRHWTFMAKDFVLFDELAVRQDAVIESLRRPAHAIEIIPEGDGK
jgi:lysophospholipase L1-like esterase